MELYFKVIDDKPTDAGEGRRFALGNGKAACISASGIMTDFKLSDGSEIFLYGDIFYYIKAGGKITLTSAKDRSFLKIIFSRNRIEDIIEHLEGQYIGFHFDIKTKAVRVFSDRYARRDCFYAVDAGSIYISTSLEYIFRSVKPVYDGRMLAHMFSVYGWYAPKGFTIYKNVRRLRVGEILRLCGGGISSKILSFKPWEIARYDDGSLQEYYSILREAVVSRAESKGKTWVSSSSGWDSSVILGILVNEFGAKNAGMISGSMKYSRATKVINDFEINKIKRIGAYYGIKPVTVDFNFKDKSAAGYWLKVLPYYRDKHTYAWVSYNFSRLSESLLNLSGGSQTILNGELSDSLHNFGFSQFATFFHTNKAFTEYADKMNCYLYGPSFFRKVRDGSYRNDRVWRIFRAMAPSVDFDDDFKSRADLLNGYLFPLFYGSPRIPFARTYDNPALSGRGKKAVYEFPFKTYMPEALAGISEENMYSWIIYLYHSLHSQGSTVNIHKCALERHGHRPRSPFNDYRMIKFLSRAPETWGRGLDINNTKYPLKWVARNKIRFPYQLLEKGPHSYLYDVIEGFSLAAEVTYRSGVTDLFKESLSMRPYRSILDNGYFDIGYLDRLVSAYLAGKQALPKDFNNLFSLITLCLTGWY